MKALSISSNEDLLKLWCWIVDQTEIHRIDDQHLDPDEIVFWSYWLNPTIPCKQYSMSEYVVTWSRHRSSMTLEVENHENFLIDKDGLVWPSANPVNYIFLETFPPPIHVAASYS